MREWFAVFKRGLAIDNPLMVLMIGLCATLAVYREDFWAFFMGLAVIFVLTMSVTIIATLKNFIPEKVRIPIFIVVIASFVTVVDLAMHAFLPGIYTFLGVWIPLIVVNCIILGRAEAFAYNNRVTHAIADGLGMGLGFSMVIMILATIRELVGSGEIVFLGNTLISFPEWYRGPGIVLLFPGAFLIFGFMVAGATWLNGRIERRKVQVSASCMLEEGGA